MKTFSLPQKIVSYILKVVIVVSATLGIYLSACKQADSPTGSLGIFMYFTDLSNVLMTIIAVIGAFFMAKDKAGPIWQVIELVGTVSITLTGVVFCVVLAPTMGPNVWSFETILVHVIVPITSVIDFFVMGKSFSIKKSKAIYVAVPPLLYVIFTTICYNLNVTFPNGNTYPYFFLNWGSKAGAFGFVKESPFMGCVWWILILLLVLIVVGLLYLFILDLIKTINCKHKKPTH